MSLSAYLVAAVYYFLFNTVDQRRLCRIRYFRRNACDFAMGIVAIADFGRRYLDKGLKYPIPTIPPYLFTPLPESRQSGAQVPVKPSQLGRPQRGCSPPLLGVLEVASDGAAVVDG